MKLSEKHDLLLARFIKLEDENKALRETLAAVHACATEREAKDLDAMLVDHGSKATDCARSIMITPAVWAAILTRK